MAQAILLKPVETLGERGEIVDVSPGYLRNYLVPRKLAQPATAAAVAEPSAARRPRSAPSARPPRRLRRTPRSSARPCSRCRQAAGADGRLFGSVTSQDIVDAIKQARGLKIDKRRVHLDEPIKTRRHAHGHRRSPRRRDHADQDHRHSGLTPVTCGCLRSTGSPRQRPAAQPRGRDLGARRDPAGRAGARRRPDRRQAQRRRTSTASATA